MALRADLLPALAAFEAAARHQNFAHAAEELHLTASAVSHHVRKLEQRLGMSLFQRHARGVALTPEGRQLADAAGAALADMDGVLSSLHSARDPSDQIRITTLHSLAYTWLMPHLARFSEPILRLVDWYQEAVLGATLNNVAHRGEPTYLFFDEIQNLKNWAPQLKSLVDHATTQVLITGSSEKSVNNAPFGLLVTQTDTDAVLDPRIVALPLSSLMLLR